MRWDRSQDQERLYLLQDVVVKKCNDVKEKLSIIKNEPEGSQKFREQLTLLHEFAKPELEELMSLLYEYIIRYNKSPETWPTITNADMLKAQMTLDDCIRILNSSDHPINIEFVTKENKV